MECSVKSISLIRSVSLLIALLSFCLVDLPIDKRGLLKSPTISVWGLMCDLSLVMFLLHMLVI